MSAPLPSQNTSLEQRVAMLEETLTRMNEFNQHVTTALKHVLDRLKDLEPMPSWAVQMQQRFEHYRAAETLARGSQIFPKSRTVVFVSKGYFGDNVKYAYLAFCEYAKDKNVNVHYLTDDPRQLAMLKADSLPCLSGTPGDWTIENVRTLFGAKVVVLGDNFHAHVMQHPQAWGMLQGAKSVQLWHGIPIKEIGMRYVLRGDNVILDELVASSGPFDLLVAPAAAAREEWAQRFAFHDYAALGYPRNDVFFRAPSAQDLLNVDLDTLMLFQNARRTGQPCIIYTPTYRDDEASSWFAKAGIDRFAEHARAKNYAFVVNLHPYEQVLMEDYRARYPDIRFVAPRTDIYPIVRIADMLITDYSSLVFDFLLLDRPVIFYRPTGDKVVVKARGFIEGRVNETPGLTASTIEELMSAVDAAAGFARAPDTDPHRTSRQDLRGRLFDHADGDAGKRVCEIIIKMIENR